MIQSIDWILTLLAGAMVTGLVRSRLTLAERGALTVVIGLSGSAALSAAVAQVAGVGMIAVLAGPIFLGVLAAAVAVAGVGAPWRPWVESWRADRAGRWWPTVAVLMAATIFFAVVFAHAMFTESGSLMAGFAPVWSDWSLHAITANSFAVGHNVPPQNPLFSGTPLRYPYLPDYQSATLLVAGASMMAALSAPSLLLCIAISALIVSLGRRLTGGVVAGTIALAICVLGGGVGFAGVAADACHRANTPVVAHCTPASVITHPAALVATVRALPGTIADQPRGYDGLPSSGGPPPVDNQQWYTPLLAWWLPQRSFVYGFAIVLTCLLLAVVAIAETERRAWASFAVIGCLAGMLPFFHVHSLIALVLVAPFLVRRPRWREWAIAAGSCAVIAVPRLVSLAGGDKGSGAPVCNAFPWVETGWMSRAVASADTGCVQHSALGVGSLLGAVPDALLLLVSPVFWWFWISNTGILMPLMVVVAIAAAIHRSGRGLPRTRVLAARVHDAVGHDVIVVALPFLTVFAVANVVVFQSWEWDNTKLLVYWHFGAALLTGALAARWLRAGRLGAVGATLGLGSLLLTGIVVMLRFLPWTPAPDAIGGPYAVVTPDQQQIGDQIAQRTPAHAVVLTGEGVNDPALTVAGRSAVMGYYGWLWSYGTDFGSRVTDTATMYAGCAGEDDNTCPVFGLLRTYHVDFAEIGDNPLIGGLPPPGQAWWAAHFPVVARSPTTVVYDVRQP